MRSVAFVHHLQWEFAGNVNAPAISLGDVDNDGNNEFVVGSVQGVLAIFKGSATRTPWQRISGLGTITCIAIADVRNIGKNSIVCVTAEGVCHIFDVHAEAENPLEAPSISQAVPVNICRLLVADIDGDGQNEFVVARTDRVLHLFRFVAQPTETDQPFVQLFQFQLPGQCGSLLCSRDTFGKPILMVAQPGGTFLWIDHQGTMHTDTPFPSKATLASDANLGVSTEMMCMHRHGTARDSYCLVSVDGNVKLCNLEKKTWELSVNHQLFACAGVDVTGPDSQEIVTCSWDGLTYIVGHDQEIVRFQYRDSVYAFTAGLYALTPGHNVPCLFYVNYTDEISVYYDIQLKSIRASSFLDVMKDDLMAQFRGLLEEEERGENEADWDRLAPSFARLLSDVLYRRSSLLAPPSQSQ